MIHLVLGGARSGKSKFAEKYCQQSLQSKQPDSSTDFSKYYIATATAGDEEMRTRISNHQNSRDPNWKLIEQPFYLSDELAKLNNNGVVLIDCLTLWLSNWLCSHDIESFSHEKDALIDQLLKFEGELVIVSNEVGSGIVPMGELSREFVDQAGWLNQAIANVADKVTLVVAGCPLILKDNNSQIAEL